MRVTINVNNSRHGLKSTWRDTYASWNDVPVSVFDPYGHADAKIAIDAIDGEGWEVPLGTISLNQVKDFKFTAADPEKTSWEQDPYNAILDRKAFVEKGVSDCIHYVSCAYRELMADDIQGIVLNITR